MTFRHGARFHAAVSEPSRASRRVLSAFALGASLSLSVAGLAALAAGVAGAHGPFVAPNAQAAAPEAEHIAIVRYQASAVPRRRDVADDEDTSRRHLGSTLRASLANVLSVGGHDPVCVRLCDGFFFPLPTAASDLVSQDADCNSLCPNAPTEVFYRNGSDRIESSVSAGGKLYTALPVSLHYRTKANDTCSCHRDAVAYAPLKDATLKPGDAIMTPAGFVVFRGVESAPHRAADFSALGAAGLAPSAKAPLQAMERASLTPIHPTLKDWLAMQNTPALAFRAPPAQVALRAASPRPAPVAGASGGKIRLLAWRGGDE
jgi:hypothetical protein